MNNRQVFLSANETNQGIVRSVNTLVILIYLLTYSYFHTGTSFSIYTAPAIIYLILTLPLFVWSVRCISLDDNSYERFSYRVIGLAGDIIFLSIVMILSNGGGTPLFFVYLWIIVGNGIRYGINYLIISTVISIICFVNVVYLTPAWQSIQLFPIAIGLLISLVILPTYILGLINRLSSALASEKAAHQVKQSFLANINHELRTPLNSILSLTELISTYNLSGNIYNMLGMISTAANSQLQIINSILDISRIEAGELRLEQKRFDLYSLIYEVYEIGIPQALNKNIDFNIYIESSCPQFLKGAHDQIKQILVNLVGNSVKFTEAGSINLSVYSSYKTSTKQGLVFEVRDTGIGISRDAQVKIFKPFVQGDSSITRKYGGTGLGISISSELSKLMGGSITLESELNKGSTFTFKLELDKPLTYHPNSLGNIKIFPCFPIDEYQYIIDYYKNHGAEIVSNEEFFNIDLKYIDYSEIIIMFDANNLSCINQPYTEYLYNYSMKKISINTIHTAMPDLHVITSIMPNSPQDDLLNAVLICNKFMGNADQGAIELPHITESLSILIAEDDPVLAEINKILFSKLNHNADVVFSGEDAITALSTNKYDIAILDLHMPGMSGASVANKYKELKNDDVMPIILLTADLSSVQINKTELSIFSRILVKPTTPIELLNTIYDCLSLSTEQKITKNKHIRLEHYHNITERSENINYKVVDHIIAITSTHVLLDILDMYDIETKAQLDKLLKLNINNDMLQIQNLLHRLKGTSSSIGMELFSNQNGFDINNKLITNTDYINHVINIKTLHDRSVIEYRKYLLKDELIQAAHD